MSPDSKECPPPQKKSGGGGGGLPPFETIRFETFISFLFCFCFYASFDDFDRLQGQCGAK